MPYANPVRRRKIQRERNTDGGRRACPSTATARWNPGSPGAQHRRTSTDAIVHDTNDPEIVLRVLPNFCVAVNDGLRSFDLEVAGRQRRTTLRLPERDPVRIAGRVSTCAKRGLPVS